MNTVAKIAVAAVAVIAIGFLGLTVLGPNGLGVGGPTPSPTPTGTPSPTAPPMTSDFTSQRYGYTIAFPDGWAAKQASEPWTSGYLDLMNKGADAVYDASRFGSVFLALASQPLGDRSADAWLADVWDTVRLDDPSVGDRCTTNQPITIDGAAGTIGCGLDTVTTAGRGYAVMRYTSGDEAWLEDAFDDTWFASILDTMQLHPEDATDAVESPTS